MEEQALRDAYARGKRAYPSTQLEFETFRAHCERVLGPAPEWDWTRFGTELYLCCACAQGDAEAMRALESDTLPQVVKAISRIDSNPEFVEEALQTLRARLLVAPRAKIADYAARGPLVAWLSVAAARVALDAIRSRNARKLHHADLPDRLAQAESSPLNDIVKSRYRDSFQRALKNAIHSLPPRERNLLRLQLVGRCSIDQLGRMYLVHRATAARWLQRARGALVTHTRGRLAARLKVSVDEIDSVIRLVQSQLDASVVRYLREDGAEDDDGQA